MGDLDKDIERDREGNGEGEGMEEDAAPTGRMCNKRQAFDEEDQEALYMRAHESQRVGKRGLGKSETLKIAGEAWNDDARLVPMQRMMITSQEKCTGHVVKCLPYVSDCI
jgi:hypothetical protein